MGTIESCIFCVNVRPEGILITDIALEPIDVSMQHLFMTGELAFATKYRANSMRIMLR